MAKMKYQPRKSELLNLVPLQARNANGSQNFSGMGLPDGPLKFDLEVTAASGTSPTLNVSVQESVDGGATYTNKASFAQKTGAGSETITVSPPHRDYMRINWTIGGSGSPSFTFSVRSDLDKRSY
jgi:hypothetical protein